MQTRDLGPPQRPPNQGGESLIGRILEERYRIDSVLGEGGVGVVYRAQHLTLNRAVAIKVLQQNMGAMPELRQRFQREATALATLSHPNIVTITDYGIASGMPYIVMELLRGRTLAKLLEAEAPIDPERAIGIVRQILRGLAFAHSRRVVHRDLKPTNVFLQDLEDASDHVRLLDFGLAKFVGDGAPDGPSAMLTKAGGVLGTPAYMAPEQAAGATSDARADVYAMGVLSFELLAGRRPFEGTSTDLMRAHLFAPVPALSDVRPDLDVAAGLQGVLQRAMAKEPASRFDDAAQMLSALEAIPPPLARRSKRPTTSPPPALNADPNAPTLPAAPHRTSGPLVAVLAVAIVGVVALAALGVAFVFVPAEEPAASDATPPAARAALPALGSGERRAADRVDRGETAAAASAAVHDVPRPTSAEEPSPSPPVAPAAAAPPEPTAASAGVAAREVEPPAPGARGGARPPRDPWSAPVPPLLASLRARIGRGAHPSERELRPLYGYAFHNPRDGRPWLLMAHTFAEREWRADALDRYRRAYRADPSARGDPQMLANLVAFAAHDVVGGEAGRMIEDWYGAEALGAVARAIDRARQVDERNRLERLRARLSGH